MARFPGADWRPIPEASTQPKIDVTQVILHVQGSGSGSLHAYFAAGSVVVESQLWVARDGSAEQYLESDTRADANLGANVRALAVETAGGGDPNVVPWTPEQCETLAQIIAWAHRVHGVPIRICTSPTSPGVGWHVMWGAPSEWTPVAKDCPGKARIPQIPGIIARARVLAAAHATPPEDDMPTPADLLNAPVTLGVGARAQLKSRGNDATSMSLAGVLNILLGSALDLTSTDDQTQRTIAQLSDVLAGIPAQVQAAVTEATASLAMTPEQREALAADVAARVARVTVIVDGSAQPTS